jgi:DNA-directed RNA polymerase specialized sigma24 family protein
LRERQINRPWELLKRQVKDGMEHVPQIKRFPVSTNRVPYAAAQDFERLFAKESIDLLALALHLTTDAEKAERCVILAMRDCVFRSSISNNRIHTWARRMVMRNAIRLVWGTPNDILGESGFEFHLQPSDFPLEALRDSVAILTLPDLDRLAFVICVLERYSILDCALLLGRAPQEVYDAVLRATNQVLPAQERAQHDATARFAGEMYGAFCGQGNSIKGSCGSILD